MNLIKPAGAPPCWGVKYQDGDPECRQCYYADNSCQPAMMHRLTQPIVDNRVSLPVVRNFAPPMLTPRPPVPPAPIAQPIIPLPPQKPAYSAAPTSIVALPPKPTTPTVPTPPTSYQQAQIGYALPNLLQPNPLAYWQRPGAQGPGYYANHYPGESMTLRVTKNVVLRILEAFFAELMQFFRHWTWPPPLAAH